MPTTLKGKLEGEESPGQVLEKRIKKASAVISATVQGHPVGSRSKMKETGNQWTSTRGNARTGNIDRGDSHQEKEDF